MALGMRLRMAWTRDRAVQAPCAQQDAVGGKSSSRSPEPGALHDFLRPAGLGSYAQALRENGYDDVEVLKQLDSGEQEEMLQTIKCLPGHKV